MKIILLSKDYAAQVDDADFERVRRYKWTAQEGRNTVYGYHPFLLEDGTRKNISLHRFILGVTNSKIQVDHKDRNGLNCQRENLRTATHAQNMHNAKIHKNNSSGFRGVGKHPQANRWQARLCLHNKQIYLGLFKTAEAAARAYDAAARKLFGEFANCNFPQEAQ
jgi:hypothetical protein